MRCQEGVTSCQRTHYKHHKVFYEMCFLEFKAMQTWAGGGGVLLAFAVAGEELCKCVTV